MSAARFGTWTNYSKEQTCSEHGPQTTGPTFNRGEPFTGLWLCAECLEALIAEFAGGPELRDLRASRG